jgi:hypothetical protein
MKGRKRRGRWGSWIWLGISELRRNLRHVG